jgi:hypothetical protein
MTHGLRSSYSVYGCRCDECRKAHRLYCRKWARDNSESKNKRQRTTYNENPDARTKQLARTALNYRLTKGDIERQPCEICGAKAEAHHDDYSKPFDVRWLCRAHHCELHRQENAQLENE